MRLAVQVFMSKGKRYIGRLKVETVKQITGCGYLANELAERLGITTKSLHNWRQEFSGKKTVRPSSDDSVRIVKLVAEFKWLTEEMDIFKKAQVLCKQTRVKHAFIREHLQAFVMPTYCRVIKIKRNEFLNG